MYLGHSHFPGAVQLKRMPQTYPEMRLGVVGEYIGARIRWKHNVEIIVLVHLCCCSISDAGIQLLADAGNPFHLTYLCRMPLIFFGLPIIFSISYLASSGAT